MSSSIRLIPTSPEYVPDTLSQEQAASYLRGLLLPNPDPSSEITARVTEYVEYVDQGGNFERVVCPFCRSDLASESSEWWDEMMDKAYEGRFADLRIVTPCCHTQSSLNDLKYEWPVGFARFVLEAYEPFSIDSEGVYQMLELSPADLEYLQETLGCGLRIIWAHY
ncbi:MAG: hypothetical protein ACJ78Q_01290 [Chloroflexia bacterium]